jgi:hypothetical protein
MKKQIYSSLTNYLAKTKKNADLYRLYNPQFSVFCKSDTEEQDFISIISQDIWSQEKYFNRILYSYIHLL